MRVDQQSFLTMRGLDVLTFLRDSVADEAENKRSFIQQCEEAAGGATPPEMKQRVRALQAAAQALQFIISLGQDERVLCAKDRGRRFPEWITRCANNARQALVEDAPDIEDAPVG